MDGTSVYLRSKWLFDLASTGRGSRESVLMGPSFARPSPNPVYTVSWSSRPCKFRRTEDLVVLDLSAETSYSQAMYFAEEAAQFCELLAASCISLVRRPQVEQHLPSGVAKRFQKKDILYDLVQEALPGVKVLWLEEYFIKNGLGPQMIGGCQDKICKASKIP